MASPVFYRVGRREPPAGPVLTPAEYNANDLQTDVTVHGFDERLPQSQIICRPSRHWIAFFLAPVDWPMGCGDFIMGHEAIPRAANTPRGRLSTMDDRRNVAIPPRVTYGSLVGDMDGVSPNGLD